MEDPDSKYRLALIDMRKYIPKREEAEICFTCVGFKSFGGLEVQDMTAGPLCVCDDTWKKVHVHIRKMEGKKLFTI